MAANPSAPSSRRSSSRLLAAIAMAGIAVVFVCSGGTTSFLQPPAPTSRRFALGGLAAGATVSLTRPAWAEEIIRSDPFVGSLQKPGQAWPGGQCKADVTNVQDKWKAAILSISKEYLSNPTGEKYKDVAKAAAGELYGYDVGNVLFKPTKAKETPFRVSAEGALSYFIGYDAIQPAGFKEDKGFAINAGKGWKEVRFENSQISCYDGLAFAQGNYFFTDYDSNVAKVEYSFAYQKMPDGKLKIVLHHSSIPFSR